MRKLMVLAVLTVCVVGIQHSGAILPSTESDFPVIAVGFQILGPYFGRTDWQGQFFIEIDEPFQFGVGGRLVDVQGEPLDELNVAVALAPPLGRNEISWVGHVGEIWVDLEDYGVEVVQAQASDLSFVGMRPTLNIADPVFFSRSNRCRQDQVCTSELRFLEETATHIAFLLRKCVKMEGREPQWSETIIKQEKRTEPPDPKKVEVCTHIVVEERKKDAQGEYMEYKIYKGTRDTHTGETRWDLIITQEFRIVTRTPPEPCVTCTHVRLELEDGDNGDRRVAWLHCRNRRWQPTESRWREEVTYEVEDEDDGFFWVD